MIPDQLMNTRNIVGAASVLLMGWLGVTFFNVVPVQRYPRVERKAQMSEVSKSIPVVSLGAKPITH